MSFRANILDPGWTRIVDHPVPDDSYFLLASERAWVWLVTTDRSGNFRWIPSRGVVFLQRVSGPDVQAGCMPEGVDELNATHWAPLPMFTWPGLEVSAP